jgi:hypothetical protein
VATYRKRQFNPMRGRKLELYGLIMARERQKLFVSAERREWILEHYPPRLNGEPILIPEDSTGNLPSQ